MSTVAEKRLMKDLKHLQDDSPPGVSSAPREDNLMVWDAVILGPEATPWEGGTFKLMLEFGSEYPNKPPKVKFISQMFHPNIYDSGIICLDILDREWSPIYDVASILTSIQSLLSDPNPGSPANGEAALLFSNDKRAYNRRVREVTEQSWIGN